MLVGVEAVVQERVEPAFGNRKHNSHTMVPVGEEEAQTEWKHYQPVNNRTFVRNWQPAVVFPAPEADRMREADNDTEEGDRLDKVGHMVVDNVNKMVRNQQVEVVVLHKADSNHVLDLFDLFSYRYFFLSFPFLVSLFLVLSSEYT